MHTAAKRSKPPCLQRAFLSASSSPYPSPSFASSACPSDSWPSTIARSSVVPLPCRKLVMTSRGDKRPVAVESHEADRQEAIEDTIGDASLPPIKRLCFLRAMLTGGHTIGSPQALWVSSSGAGASGSGAGVLVLDDNTESTGNAHRITVVTSFLLERVLQNRSATGRIAEWSLELSGFDIRFTNTSTIKSMALADFIAEWTPTPGFEEEPRSSLPSNEDAGWWVMYFDGSFSYEGAGAGVLIVSPTGEHLKYIVQLDFGNGQSTNNTAKYEGLLAGLRVATGLGIKQLVVRGDSQLVINLVMKEYDCPQMRVYVDEVRKLERHFDGIQMEHVPRGQNHIADELSKMAASGLLK